ncbi:hypothetical protein IRZ71_02620 [Flavobacterium sp. ANB]|uniref:hypothetical protein n=1 Tax=unclassified Flavobacterium TaxID=196869 RepID=UPI0012BA3780|nr:MULTISPECIES: hypothetical protein [unclassified Flavobacterium]MBF4515213.1 hypothetical protein [Flavobacterium sp. ANB]MTD70125.1 hypothetical protein [Flavobacterium sp. LC2016-13]
MISPTIGEVYAVSFQHIDHDKYIVIVGVTLLGTYVCAPFINSKINQFIINKKPHLVSLHIPITQNKNRFLSHDSFVACDEHNAISVQKLNDLEGNGMCRFLGILDAGDLVVVKDAFVNSGLLTAEELYYYFQIPIP